MDENNTLSSSTPTLRSGTTEITVTVPTIKGTIPEAIVTKMAEQGYVKARAVVVYPNMQDRKVVCQGMANPTLYTKSHRGNGNEDDIKDLYAQSSWFFRPYYTNSNNDGNYREDVNIPYSEHGKDIRYMDNTVGDGSTSGYSPVYIKRTEIQGHFYEVNKFKVDWRTLTFHSPDIEFDTQMQNLDYASSALGCSYVGDASFKRTLSDIDIRTETPTISDQGSGFVKKSFTRNGAAGIISGLFWDDFEVDDFVEEDDDGNTQKFKWFQAFSRQGNSAKWMVYLWNRNGSLNNDIDRPADCGVKSAVLKKKIISNLRFSDKAAWKVTYESRSFKTHLFVSDQNEILKLDTGDSSLSNIYRGNIDTLVNSDQSDGMYFAFIPKPPETEDQDIIYGSAEFTSQVKWKTFEDENKRHGNWRWESNIWHRLDDEDTGGDSWLYKFEEPVGGDYKDLVLKKNSVRIKYKSTPHLVLAQQDSSNNPITPEGGNLPILELRRNVDDNTIFGGTSQDALRENLWIPCGEPVRLDDWAKDDQGNIIGNEGNRHIEFEYSWGDTYYQRYDCLKTYAYTPEDINQVVEIGSFMLETYVNIDGRYDRNRGQLSNLYMSPQNFNLINPVYSQLNNFFTYKIQDSDAYKQKYFPNQITWSKTKTSGADVDLWTNVTLASILEMDGDKGRVRKLTRLNDQLFCFQDKGISQVLYNDNVQISSTDGVPIEIANSGKVMGKKYFSDSIGCSNKWSMAQTPSGIYFMDSINKAIFLFNGQLNNLSGSLGFNAWAKNNIPSGENTWTPTGFEDFVSYYDKLNQDVLFINKDTALAYSEKLGVFTSFYDYGSTPYFCNLQDTGIWLRNPYEETVEEEGSEKTIIHPTALWKHNAGNYCTFFGAKKPFSMTLIGNPEPQMDKIFTNLEFRACVDGDGEMETETIVDPDTQEETIVETGRFIPSLPFDTLETWNEYQHGIAVLKNMKGHSLFKHHNKTDIDASLIRKFRIWRCDIPRSNAALALDEGLNCYRKDVRPQDRMRNPWLYLKLMKNAESSNHRTEVHDILMTYFD